MITRVLPALSFYGFCWVGVTLPMAVAAAPPQPYGPTPSPRQLAWHDLEVYGFIHFGLNTFTDKEWGYGDESPQLFAPTAFDADQIVGAAKEAGMKGLMLTCKHHDGFCLWPSKYTEHSVKHSPWKDGKGDLVRDISNACRHYGLKFGVYLSPWDRNHKDYGRPEYLVYYRNQLRELLGNYGPVFEMWFDGANGGDGYYGGARERRRIDNRTYYDWENTWQIVRELQPQACMFSDGGPDVRWVGNESGFAGETCWATFNKAGTLPGVAQAKELNVGHRPGTDWLPAEVDVSIRPGWFYHATQDTAVKSVAHLLKIYFESVGRGANLILNIPPDRRGLIHENDVQALRQWRKILDATFARDLARGAKVTASHIRGNDPQFEPGNVIDGNRQTYWATDDGVSAVELVLDLGRPITFNVVRVREYLPLGQRIDGIAFDAWRDDKWEDFATATSIGNQRLIAGRYLTTSRVRLRVTSTAACPAISEIGLFSMPVPLGDPTISRDRHGLVSIACQNAGPWIRYTLDGTEPTAAAPLFTAPFPLPQGGTFTARAFLPAQQKQSGVARVTFGLAKEKWRIRSATSFGSGGEAGKAIDENPFTLWHTRTAAGPQPAPQDVVIDLGSRITIRGFTLLPRQDGQRTGIPDRYEFYVTDDLKKWGSAAAISEFANIGANPAEQTVLLKQPTTGRFIRFVATHVVEGKEVSVAELGVLEQ